MNLHVNTQRIYSENKKQILEAAIGVFFMLAWMVGCQDENVEIIGVCPVVLSTNPTNLAINIPLDQTITVTFNEPMNPLTIDLSSFSLQPLNSAGRGGAGVSGALTYDASSNSMSFVPANHLSSATTYIGTVEASVKDKIGVPLQAKYRWTFTTVPPTVITSDPLDLATGIALNKVISATFSEVMNPLTLTNSTFTLMTGAVAVSGAVSYSGATATLAPTIDLLPGTLYTATITKGAKTPLGASLVSNYIWTFTTGASPTVISTDPINLAAGISLGKVLSATFNEAMDPLTMTASTFTVKAGTTPVAGTVSYTGVTSTFMPLIILLPGTVYTATITTGAKNILGTPLANDYVWTFTTGASPTVTLTDPLNLATGVALTKVVSATFSEAMDALTITGSTFTLKAGATTVAGTLNYSGTTVTLTPTVDLLPGNLYTATITTGAKNPLGIGLASDYVWTFTTGASPTVTLTDPLDLATGVALNKVISATFSEAMDALTLTNSTFTLKAGATTVAGTLNYSGTTATLTPTVDLLPGTVYTATITTAAKNPLGIGLASDYVWTFTTGASPTVTLTDPLNLATGVALNKVVSATFSEAMDALTITGSTFTLKAGATTVAGTLNYSGTTATLTPTVDLLPGTLYTATITTGAKNPLGIGLAIDYVWTFTTGASPTVTLTDPLNLANGVALNKVISATFSEAMDALTITGSTFTLKAGATTVAGTLNYSGTTATLTPTVDLLPGTVYTATITTGAKNPLGIGLASDYVWTFTTSASPTVTLTDPTNNETNVVLNKVITANFSEAMSSLTITATTFTLVEGVNSVAGTVSYSGTTATFTPTANLLSGTTYTATITTGAANLIAIPLASNYVWTFTTVAPLGPLVVDLKTVSRFGVIGATAVTNGAGLSEIHDMDVGISPGLRSSIAGFPPAVVVNGGIYASDDNAAVAAMLIQAKQDLTDAYLFAEASTSPAPVIVAGDQGGILLVPGIYKSTSTLLVQAGNLTLDAQGDVNAVWIFQIATALTTTGGAGGSIVLIGGAQSKNIFWQVGSSAVIGDNTSFKGNVLALTSITMNPGAIAEGRMLARNAAVTLTSTNIINKP